MTESQSVKLKLAINARVKAEVAYATANPLTRANHALLIEDLSTARALVNNFIDALVTK